MSTWPLVSGFPSLSQSHPKISPALKRSTNDGGRGAGRVTTEVLVPTRQSIQVTSWFPGWNHFMTIHYETLSLGTGSQSPFPMLDLMLLSAHEWKTGASCWGCKKEASWMLVFMYRSPRQCLSSGPYYLPCLLVSKNLKDPAQGTGGYPGHRRVPTEARR